MDSTELSDQEIVSQTADDILHRSITEFLEASFRNVLVAHNKSPSQTQARASLTGNTFELCLAEIFDRRYPKLVYEQNVDLPSAQMEGVGGADFVIYESSKKRTIHSVIEAKGSADKIKWPDGTVQEPSRPGLKRSDTLKKGICQAYQVMNGLDTDINFFIFTTHKPKSSSKKQLLQMAHNDIITEVIDVTDSSELEIFYQYTRTT